jgi:hypothetical protein
MSVLIRPARQKQVFCTTVDRNGGWQSQLILSSVIATKPNGIAGIQLDGNGATGDFTLSLSPANLTAARRWSFPDRSDTVAGLGAQTFTGVQACAAQLYVRGASIGALGVATASETAPQSVASWDATKHVILGGAASATNSAACGIMFNQTNSEFSLVSLTPGISWNNIALRCATFGVFPSGAATAAFSVAAGAGDISVTSATDATSTTAAALVVSGGIGVAKRLTLDGATGKTIKYVNGTANAAVAVTFGAVGPTGSTAGNAQGWLRVDIAGTDRYIPYW